MRLKHPVVFVGEIEELAFDAEPLQGVKGRDALGVYYAVIQGSVNDEHWGLPVFDEVDGVVFFIALWICPRRSSMVPFGEP